MKRVLLAVLVAVPLLAVAADVVAWRWTEQQLRAGLDQWVAARRAQGWTVTMAAPLGGGWPLSASLAVPDLLLSGGGFPGGMSWSAPRVELLIAPLQPRRLVIAVTGQQHLGLAGLVIPVTAEAMQAVVPLAPGADPEVIEVTATRLSAALPGEAVATAADVRLRLDPAVVAQAGHAAATFDLRLSDISLPAGVHWPLGSQIAALSAVGTLEQPQATGLAAWRDGGGTLQFRQLVLDWGRLHVDASANLALDAQLQPYGAAQLQVTGAPEAVDAMAAGGVIKPQMALAAKAVLSLMSRPAADGREQADVPLTLQDHTLSMGRIPLLRLPALAWPPA